MKDSYERTLQCPKCSSYRVIPVHVPFSGSRRLCKDCGYEDREEYFRAIPMVTEEELKFNPSRR